MLCVDGRKPVPTWFEPRDAHTIYYGLLRACGAPRFRAWRCWLAVALYGWLHGNRRRYVSFVDFSAKHSRRRYGVYVRGSGAATAGQ